MAKIYFSDVPVPPSSLIPEQYALVQEFRRECRSTGLFATFSNPQQFRTDFRQHLDLELNQPRYLWLAAPKPVTQTGTGDLGPDSMRLIRAAASDDGSVIIQETLSSNGLSAGQQEFMDGTPRSAAKWRAIVKELADTGILEGTDETGLYQLRAVGFEIADKARSLEEASRPTEISLNVAGPPDSQYLDVRSNRDIRLSQLDFLTSTEACISTQTLSLEGREIEAELAHEKVVALFNSPRTDRHHSDFSGPAKLRLSFYVQGRLQEALLPVVLQPRIVNSTQWVTLTGSKTFQLVA